jgi:hypothetical protein
MATWTDVTRILRSVPAVERTTGRRDWRMKKRLVAWERPLRQADLDALGDAAPEGPILGVRVPLEVKEALLATKGRYCFTTPHFDGYPAILIQLERISAAALRRLLVSACEERARKR